jgi:hypothetical protein
VLQQWVRDHILDRFKGILSPDDVRSTSSGSNGEDVLLSPLGRSLFQYSVECKNLASIAMYKWYEQAEANSGKHEPLLIMKANRKQPLAVVDAKHFFDLVAELATLRREHAKKN